MQKESEETKISIDEKFLCEMLRKNVQIAD